MAQFNNPIPLISPIQGNPELASGFQLKTEIDTSGLQRNFDSIINARIAQKQQQQANYEKRMFDVMDDLDTSSITDPEALTYVNKSEQTLRDFIQSPEGASAIADPINNKELFMKYQQLQGSFKRDIEIAKQTTALDKTFLGVLGSNKGDAEVNKTQYDNWKKLPYEQRRNTPLIPYDKYGSNMSDADVKMHRDALVSKFQTSSEALANDKGTNLVTTSKILYQDDALKTLQQLSGGDLIDRYKYVSKEKYPTIEDYAQSQMGVLGLTTSVKQDASGRKYYELIDDAKITKNDQYQTEEELRKQREKAAADLILAKTNNESDERQNNVKEKEATKRTRITASTTKSSTSNKTTKSQFVYNLGIEGMLYGDASKGVSANSNNGSAFTGNIKTEAFDDLYGGSGDIIGELTKSKIIPETEDGQQIYYNFSVKDGVITGLNYTIGKGKGKDNIIKKGNVSIKYIQALMDKNYKGNPTDAEDGDDNNKIDPNFK